MKSKYKEVEDWAHVIIADQSARVAQFKDVQKRIKGASINVLNWERAEQAVTAAAKATHDAIALNLSSISSQAVNEVIGKTCYELKIYTKETRTKIELGIDLYKSGKFHGNPIDSNGGGICDILSVTLLFVCWKMSGDRSRDLFILDEPFKNLSSDYQENACAFFQELAESLGLKVLMVTHIPRFIDGAHNKIRIQRKKGASCILTETTN